MKTKYKYICWKIKRNKYTEQCISQSSSHFYSAFTCFPLSESASASGMLILSYWGKRSTFANYRYARQLWRSHVCTWR